MARKKSRRRRTAAQRAATRKMLAAAKRARGGRSSSHKKRRRRRRRSQVSHTSPPRSSPMRRRRKSRGSSRRRSSRRRGMRRGFALVGGLNSSSIMTAALTAGGFAGVNVLLDKLSTPGTSGKALLPASLATGYGRIGAKAGVSVAASWLLRRFAGRSVAQGVLIGGLVSVGLDVLSLVLPQSAASGVHGTDDWTGMSGESGDHPRALPGSNPAQLSTARSVSNYDQVNAA